MCGSQSVLVSNTCVPAKEFVVAIIVPCIVVILILAGVYVRHRVRRADALWQINSKEVKFKNPPEVLGKGSFGVVSFFVRMVLEMCKGSS